MKLFLARHRNVLAAGIFAVAMLGAQGAAHAQDTDAAGIAQIEADVDASATPEAALAMADSQAAAGDLTGSATTLERGLINDPDAYALRVRYVETLCMLDDPEAAKFEYGKLVTMQVSPEATAQIDQVCAETSISVH